MKSCPAKRINNSLKTNPTIRMNQTSGRIGSWAALAVAGMLAWPAVAPAQTATNLDGDIQRIREEGLNHSQVMKTLSYLTDVIGPRLTGSPNLKHANEWTRDKLTEWGLTNAHLEPWGPFGRGWVLKSYRAEVVEPYFFPVIGAPKAWSPSMKKQVTADVIYIDAQTEADLEKYKGKLKGAIVLTSPPRNVALPLTAAATRRTESNLVEMASATSATAGGRRGGRGAGTGGVPLGRILALLLKEGAALAVSPTGQGDTGTIFVSQVALPTAPTNATNSASAPAAGGRGARGPTYYSVNAPATPPQIMLAVEDYNRLVRMVQQGVKVRMTADLQVEFLSKDTMAYNTIAEIPGTDLKSELVMLGGHMDSWQSGTGATDNGVGVGACMEAVRIIKTLGLKPRRTIRVALWSGEEQGLFGSRAYVSNHFGFTNQSGVVMKGPEFDKFSSYFNLDNGSGKIRGIYMQGNGALRPLFTSWLEPFHDLDAQTVTIQGTGSTDHVAFDNIGLPGFQFIQDGLDYGTRTHHSNQDVYDRIQADDIKQASTIMAAFVYRAAMMDEKMPRKTATAPTSN
jgi:hypothetical protein